MAKLYRSAQGALVDMEKLRLSNEETIAVGNMKVNARGDQLGPGGRVIKTRNQLMKEHYQINPATPRLNKPVHKSKTRPVNPVTAEEPVVADSVQEPAMPVSVAVEENISEDRPKFKIKKPTDHTL